MKSKLAVIVLIGFLATGCSNKAVEYDPEKTVPFDKNRDTAEKLVGGGIGGKTKTPKKDFMKGQ